MGKGRTRRGKGHFKYDRNDRNESGRNQSNHRENERNYRHNQMEQGSRNSRSRFDNFDSRYGSNSRPSQPIQRRPVRIYIGAELEPLAAGKMSSMVSTYNAQQLEQMDEELIGLWKTRNAKKEQKIERRSRSKSRSRLRSMSSSSS